MVEREEGVVKRIEGWNGEELGLRWSGAKETLCVCGMRLINRVIG